LSLSPEELIGQDRFRARRPADQLEALSELKKRCHGEREPLHVEMPITDAQGKVTRLRGPMFRAAARRERSLHPELLQRRQ